jgi:multidrug efflux pump subunit AcrB
MPLVVARLRRALGGIAGARLILQAVQDIRVGGRQSNAQYQYTVLGDSSPEVYGWGPKLTQAMSKDPTFQDVSSDQQMGGISSNVQIDRAQASRLGLTMSQIDNTLYDAFGQRSVSTIYNALNQYYVVMEVAPKYWQDPGMLGKIWVSTSGAPPSGSATTALAAGSVAAPTPRTGPAAMPRPATPSLSSAADSASNASAAIASNPGVLTSLVKPIGGDVNVFGAGASSGSGSSTSSAKTSSTSTAANNAVRTAAQSSIGATGGGGSSTGAAVATSVENMIPLSAVASFGTGTTPLAVNHQSQSVATTISFNLPADKSLSDAQAAIQKDEQAIGFPSDLHGGFAGTAQVYEQSLSGEVYLILAALGAIYIVLGVLYESLTHPLTIMSTLPSASVGAFIALDVFGVQFTIIALIGVVLLIGIVKKNAILMIDFALKAERDEGLSSKEAIFRAASLRFRPILMTTTAALLGAVPLCFSFGIGSELRQPLGITIVGGLLVSQLLTLYTTPAVYLALDRLRLRAMRRFGSQEGPQEGPHLGPGSPSPSPAE